MLQSTEVRRLMTVPGVNVICAATFLLEEAETIDSALRHVEFLD